MRIWSLHPRHLDRAGLVACWRETLLAQAVLAGRTRGYRNHPQLERFRAQPDPLAAVGAYLVGLQAEATARTYRFDASRINEPADLRGLIEVTDGQLAFERDHLLAKLRARSPDGAKRLEATSPEAHPLLTVVSGPVAPWERG